MVNYKNIKELENKILSEDDTVTFIINENCAYKYIINTHTDFESQRRMFYLCLVNPNGYNDLIIKKLNILSHHKFIEKYVSYSIKEYNDVVILYTLEDLTKITIQLLKMCENIK